MSVGDDPLGVLASSDDEKRLQVAEVLVSNLEDAARRCQAEVDEKGTFAELRFHTAVVSAKKTLLAWIAEEIARKS